MAESSCAVLEALCMDASEFLGDIVLVTEEGLQDVQHVCLLPSAGMGLGHLPCQARSPSDCILVFRTASWRLYHSGPLNHSRQVDTKEKNERDEVRE